MVFSKVMGQVRQQGFALRSIQHPNTRVSVLYRQGDLEVISVEVGAGASLAESSLWGGDSWHLVVEGQAIFQQRDRRWELLPEESLCLKDSAPYTITNPAPERLRLLVLLFKQEESNHHKGGKRS